MAAILVLSLIPGCAKSTYNPTPTQTPTPSKESLPRTIIMASRSVGSGSHTDAMGMVTTLEKFTGSKIAVEPYGADMEIFTVIRGRKDAIAHASSTQVWTIVGGLKEYAEPEWGPQRLRILVGGILVVWGIVTSKATGIKTFDDLKGKRIPEYVGSPATEYTIQTVLEANGVPLDEVKRVKFAETTEAIRGLMEGTVDCAIAAVVSPVVLELDATKGAVFLPFKDKPEMRAVMAKKMESQFILNVKAGHGGPGYGVHTDMVLPGSTHMLLAYDTLDDSVAYWIAKAMIEGYDMYKDISKLGGWTRDRATNLALLAHAAPFHPGAVMYYKEIGDWTAEHEKLQGEQLQAEEDRIAAWKKQLQETK